MDSYVKNRMLNRWNPVVVNLVDRVSTYLAYEVVLADKLPTRKFGFITAGLCDHHKRTIFFSTIYADEIVLLHELVHATARISSGLRKAILKGIRHNEKYISYEETIADIGSLILADIFDIDISARTLNLVTKRLERQSKYFYLPPDRQYRFLSILAGQAVDLILDLLKIGE